MSAKWGWSIWFFAVFLASLLTLIILGAMWVVIIAASYGGPFMAGVVLLIEVCVASFILWILAEENGYA